MFPCVNVCFAQILLTAGTLFLYPLSSAAESRLGEETGIFENEGFSAWIPQGMAPLGGLIIRAQGFGEGSDVASETIVYDLQWRALASKLGFGLVSTSRSRALEWGGEDPKIESALAEFSRESGRPELPSVPWALWGHSEGAGMVTQLAHQYPGRVIATVLLSGPRTTPIDEEIVQSLSRAPLLLQVGAGTENHQRFANIFSSSINLFQRLRSQGAPVTLAVNPETGHHAGDSRMFAIPWIIACLKHHRHGISEAASYSAVYPFSTATGTSWLPERALEQSWKTYLRTGTVVPGGVPDSAPTDLKAYSTREGGVVIGWKAEADALHGIRTFRVFRDGIALAPYRSPTAKGQTTTRFRSPVVHDAPEKPLSRMRYTDTTAKAGETYNYTVTLVGLSRVQSLPSAPLEVSVSP